MLRTSAEEIASVQPDPTPAMEEVSPTLADVASLEEVASVQPVDQELATDSDEAANVQASASLASLLRKRSGQLTSRADAPAMPVPPVDLPVGWEAVWSADYARFWYFHAESGGQTWEKPP